MLKFLGVPACVHVKVRLLNQINAIELLARHLAESSALTSGRMLIQGRVLSNEMDKEALKEFVRQQIAFGKPLFAPWYRDKDGDSPRGHADQNRLNHFGNENMPRFGPRKIIL